jgi:exodeoxyribonuclease V alpha subunit
MAASITSVLRDANRFAKVISRDGNTLLPVIHDRRGGTLYFSRYYAHERGLKNKLYNRLQSPAVQACATHADVLRQAVCDAAQYEDFHLSSEQMCGVYLALNNRFSIISGGPGTGKTTMVCSILRALLHVSPQQDIQRIHLVAPTGRAGQRMGESIRHEMDHARDETPVVRRQLGTLSGTTVHRLLKYNPSRHRFVHNANNRLAADTVIIDEASMIDVALMDRLLEAIPDTARIVFLGDQHQLPSVEAGAVLGDLIPAAAQPEFTPDMISALRKLIDSTGAQDIHLPTVPNTDAGPLTNRIMLLSQSRRFSGRLAETAAAINAGHTDYAYEYVDPVIQHCTLPEPRSHTMREAWGMDWAGPETMNRCLFINAEKKSVRYLQDLLFSWTYTFLVMEHAGVSYRSLVRRTFPDEVLFDADRLVDQEGLHGRHSMFKLLERAQILTLIRHGMYGANGINRLLMQQWRELFDPRGRGTCFAGAPVMIVRNSASHALYNGDIGIILRAESGRYAAVFPRGNRLTVHAMENLPAHQPAFAFTVHKSQGSQYGRVLLVLPPNADHVLLSRQILYTGMTRAQETVFIYTTPDALSHAIRTGIIRYSGLNLWTADQA